MEEDMLNRSISLLGVAVSLALATTALHGQSVTLGGGFGGLSGVADLNQTGSAKWRVGWAAAVDGTYWLHRNVGLRASAGWAQDSLGGTALPGRGKFNKFTYDADVVLRYPRPTGSGSLTPYLLGGVGAISLHQLDSDSTWTKLAGNFGAGIEYSWGRLGLRAEGRDYIYKFDRFGFDKTQHDIAWQGGITVSF
jgi:hypothetical protein